MTTKNVFLIHTSIIGPTNSKKNSPESSMPHQRRSNQPIVEQQAVWLWRSYKWPKPESRQATVNFINTLTSSFYTCKYSGTQLLFHQKYYKYYLLPNFTNTRNHKLRPTFSLLPCSTPAVANRCSTLATFVARGMSKWPLLYLDASLWWKRYKDAEHLGVNWEIWHNPYLLCIFQEVWYQKI